MAHDPDTGAATQGVAVLAVDGPDSVVLWIPLGEAAASDWRARIAATNPAEAVDRWMEEADGVSCALVKLTPPGAPDLGGDVLERDPRHDAVRPVDSQDRHGQGGGPGGLVMGQKRPSPPHHSPPAGTAAASATRRSSSWA